MGHLKDEILKAYDEVCGKKRGVEVNEILGSGMRWYRRQ